MKAESGKSKAEIGLGTEGRKGLRGQKCGAADLHGWAWMNEDGHGCLAAKKRKNREGLLRRSIAQKSNRGEDVGRIGPNFWVLVLHRAEEQRDTGVRSGKWEAVIGCIYDDNLSVAWRGVVINGEQLRETCGAQLGKAFDCAGCRRWLGAISREFPQLWGGRGCISAQESNHVGGDDGARELGVEGERVQLPCGLLRQLGRGLNLPTIRLISNPFQQVRKCVGTDCSEGGFCFSRSGGVVLTKGVHLVLIKPIGEAAVFELRLGRLPKGHRSYDSCWKEEQTKSPGHHGHGDNLDLRW